MKVAFTGRSGTGKTTTMTEVLKVLEKQDLKLDVCPVGSREVSAEMGFESPYDVDAFGKRSVFQHKLFDLKKKWEDEHENFITDRTHLDNLVYSVMHDCVNTVTKNFIKNIYEACLAYDLIVVFPESVFLDTADDPLRVSQKDYHEVYQKMLDMFLNDFMDYTNKDPEQTVYITTLTKPKFSCRVERISDSILDLYNKR